MSNQGHSEPRTSGTVTALPDISLASIALAQKVLNQMRETGALEALGGIAVSEHIKRPCMVD